MNIDKLVENSYRKNKEESGSIIEEVMRMLTEISAKDDQGTKIDIKLPTIKFTENWGSLENQDRERIEAYMKNVTGTTVEEKLTSLRSILSGTKTDASLGEILSTLIAVEILSNLAGPIGTRGFTEAAAGFIFEGFLAGLFGGKSVQITSPEEIEGMDSSGKPITDVVLNGKHYSLKLLGAGTVVKGSFQNIVGHFEKLDHVYYLDARRTSDGGLQFGEFLITLENFLDVFYEPFKRIDKDQVYADATGQPATEAIKFIQTIKPENITSIRVRRPKIATASTKKQSSFSVEEFMDLEEEFLQDNSIVHIKYNKDRDHARQSSKIKRLFGDRNVFSQFQTVSGKYKENPDSGDRRGELLNAMRNLPGYKNREQFQFTPAQAEKITTFRPLGPPLPLGEGNLKKVWENYSVLLMETIQPVYKSLQSFTDNVNNYFLSQGEKVKNRHGFGERAIYDAVELKKVTNSAIKSIEDEK